ncbi:trimeric intracellular cation channel family protein [bacterium]|nr:trimeric intracellular cation channel family protein [bacterium]
MHFLYPFDLLGTFFFAISGTLAASKKQLDVFGVLMIGFITAIGGGSVRDIVLGKFPLVWIQDANYALVILAGFVVSLLFRKFLLRLRKTFFLFDTVGIAFFTIMGLQKALSLEAPMVVAVFLGMTSAVMGGMIRDVICNDIPLIFRTELYATACLSGAIVYIIMAQFSNYNLVNALSGFVVIILMRLLAIRFRWRLPVLGTRDGA